VYSFDDFICHFERIQIVRVQNEVKFECALFRQHEIPKGSVGEPLSQDPRPLSRRETFFSDPLTTR
jgi:hypothetical protein